MVIAGLTTPEGEISGPDIWESLVFVPGGRGAISGQSTANLQRTTLRNPNELTCCLLSPCLLVRELT